MTTRYRQNIEQPTAPERPHSEEHWRPGPYRRFEVCCNAAIYSDDNENTRRWQGFGMTVGEVVEDLEKTYRDCWNEHVIKDGEPVDKFCREWEDLVVWEARRVMAVVRCGPDGVLDIERFDGLDGGGLVCG